MKGYCVEVNAVAFTSRKKLLKSRLDRNKDNGIDSSEYSPLDQAVTSGLST